MWYAGPSYTCLACLGAAAAFAVFRPRRVVTMVGKTASDASRLRSVDLDAANYRPDSEGPVTIFARRAALETNGHIECTST